MKAETKATLVFFAIVIGIFAMVIVAMIEHQSMKETKETVETVEIPEGNFSVLSSNQVTTVAGGKGITVVSDGNVTCWIYNGAQKGGISCIPNWQLTPPQNMSNNCNCT